VDINGGDFETARNYAALKGIGGILKVLDDENIEIHNLEKGEVSKVTISELLKA